MKGKIYLVPGMGENCKMVSYKKLAEAFVLKGYQVIPVNPDWYKPISTQIFPVEKVLLFLVFLWGLF